MTRVLWFGLAVTAIAAQAVTLLAPVPKLLVWNASASVPKGLYRVAAVGALEVPDLVVVTPPARIAQFLGERGYLPRGAPMLKRVAALPGQTVCRRNWEITVDGVAFGKALRRDRLGRVLPAWRGCRRVGPQQVFLMNAGVRDSLDGRYFGLMPMGAITGRATPLLTDEDGDGRFVWTWNSLFPAD